MRLSRVYGVCCCLALVVALGADDQGPVAQGDREALSELQDFIGGWKGAGQLRRGKRSDGDWAEKADWAWQFDEGRAAIVFHAPEGKYYRSGRIVPGSDKGEFVLVGTLPDDSEERFTGKLSDGRVIFTAEEPRPDRPAQISLRMVAEGARLLVLYEKRQGTTLTRLAEVGYTRVGSGFGKGATGPECVVTGGYGSMKVEYKGKTYYVCCTGCLDLFNADPEGVLKDYYARKEAEKKGG